MYLCNITLPVCSQRKWWLKLNLKVTLFLFYIWCRTTKIACKVHYGQLSLKKKKYESLYGKMCVSPVIEEPRNTFVSLFFEDMPGLIPIHFILFSFLRHQSLLSIGYQIGEY